MKKSLIKIFIFITVTSTTNVVCQESFSKGFIIKRMEVIKTDGYLSDEIWSSNELNALFLIQKSASYKVKSYNGWEESGYNYYGWHNANKSSQTLNNGTVLSSFDNSAGLSIEVKSQPQWLEVLFVNNSENYLFIDASSLSYGIYIKDKNGIWTVDYDNFKTMNGTLFNIFRGEYDHVLLPPNSKSNCSFFRIDGKAGGYDIINDIVLDAAEARFDFKIKIFLNNPIKHINIPIQSNKKYQYSQNTPIPSLLNYKGPSYKNDDGALFIHNDYISDFDNCDINAKIKVVLEVKKTYQKYPVIKDKFGLLRYK